MAAGAGLDTGSGSLGATVEVSEIETLANGTIIAGDGAGAPTTVALMTAYDGTLKHEFGGVEADISAIADGGLLVGTGAGSMAIRAGALTAGAAGFLTHEVGGLEADVSAYNGLVKISGGAASAVTIGVANGNIPQMDATGYPAADGSQITNITASDATKLPLAGGTMTGNVLWTGSPNIGSATVAEMPGNAYLDGGLILARAASTTSPPAAAGTIKVMNIGGFAHDATNWESLDMYWSANVAYVTTAAGGTGVGKAMVVGAGGATLYLRSALGTGAFHISTGNDLLADGSASDIGSTTVAQMPQNIYLDGGLQLADSGATTMPAATANYIDAYNDDFATDATNYERAQLGWTGNFFWIKVNAGGTGTQRGWAMDTGTAASCYIRNGGVGWKLATGHHLEAEGAYNVTTTGTLKGALDITAADGAGANTATLTNSPTTGNPSEWLTVKVGGATRYIPCWT